MDHMFNEFYTPEIAQWLADNADIDGRPPTALSLAQPTSHHPSSLQPRTQESTSRAPRRLDADSHTARFHPYIMATRRGLPPHPNPDNQRGFGYSVPRAVRSQLRPIVQTPPSTVYPGCTTTSSLTSHLYQSGSASTIRASSSTAGLTSIVPPAIHLHTSPYPQSSWAPLGQSLSQNHVWHSSSTSGSASSAIHSSGSVQSSTSSSRSSSRLRLNPSPIPTLHDGQDAGHLPAIFAPRPTQAQASTFSEVFAESDRSESSEAGPSSQPLRNNSGKSDAISAGRLSSTFDSSSDVQGTSALDVDDPSDAEDPVSSTDQAWFSPEEFAENHTWNIHCRLARHSKTRGLFDKTGTALDPAFNQNVECGATFDDPAAFVQHLELQHRVTNAKHGQKGLSRCAWAGCNSELGVGSYHRHIAEKHAMHWRCPYKECTGRHIRKGVNRTIGGNVQSYARINLLENHIRNHHSGDDLATMKAAYGDGWKLAYAVLTPQIGGVGGTA